MSKGITCDICRKTTNVPDYDRTCALPAEFTGWYHLGVSRRVVEDGNPFDKLQYREIDICPKCVEKIRDAKGSSEYDPYNVKSGVTHVWDLIGMIAGE